MVHRCCTGSDSDTSGPHVGTGATVQVLILTPMVHRWERELYCTGSDSDAMVYRWKRELYYTGFDSDTSGPHVGTGAILYMFWF